MSPFARAHPSPNFDEQLGQLEEAAALSYCAGVAGKTPNSVTRPLMRIVV